MNDIWLTRFIKEALPLIEEEYHPSRIVFFGSRVTGCPTEDSDLDVIIVSDEFKSTPFVNRMGQILNLIWFPIHVDFLCYTPEEFERIQTWSPVIRDALKTGVDADLHSCQPVL